MELRLELPDKHALRFTFECENELRNCNFRYSLREAS